MADMLPRVLIASASIGSGHVAAARALESAFGEQGAQVLNIDLLDFTSAPFRRLYREAYFDLVRTAPDLIDWLGKRLDRYPPKARSRTLRLRARLVRLISYHLPRTINDFEPTLLVHTHFLPAEILSTQRRRLPGPQAVVVTDYVAHRLWVQPNVSRYFVATEEVEAHLRSVVGENGTDVVVSGIPVDRRFRRLEEKTIARQMLRLSADSDLLLVMAGGMSAATLGTLLRHLRSMRHHLQVVIVCGRTPELQRVAHLAVEGAEGPVTFQVYGFTEEVPRLMAASDLLLGKPGGLTTSEALAAGLPFAIVDPYPLQEEANANYLLEHGAGMRIDPLSTLELKLTRFFSDPGRRSAMGVAARALGHPDAADQVARNLLDNPPRPGSGK